MAKKRKTKAKSRSVKKRAVAEGVPVAVAVPHSAWQKGQSGNPAGRPVGSKNKATLAGKELCEGLLADPVYQAKFRKDFLARELPYEIEKLVWHYGYGVPKQTVEARHVFDHAAFLGEEAPVGDDT